MTNGSRSLHSYLRFVSLESLPGLASKLPLDRVLELAGPRVRAANLLLGDGSLSSDLHFDDADNLLLQLVGTKEVLLLPPEQLEQGLDFPELEERRYVVRSMKEEVGKKKEEKEEEEEGATHVHFAGDKATGRPPILNHAPYSAFGDAAAAAAAAGSATATTADRPRPLIPADVLKHATLCTLREGEALFIPALWTHAILSIPSTHDSKRALRGLNAAVNVWYDRRLNSFDHAVRAAPTFAQAHFCRGGALQAHGRLDEAAHAYETSLSLMGQRQRGRYTGARALGSVLVQLGGAARLERALAVFEEASALGPDYSDAEELKGEHTSALVGLARALDENRQHERAWSRLDAARRLSPDDLTVRREFEAARRRREVRNAGGWSRHVERRLKKEAGSAPPKDEVR